MVLSSSSALFIRLNYSQNVFNKGKKAVTTVLSGSFNNLVTTQRLYTADPGKTSNVEDQNENTSSKGKISRAMRAYLQRAKTHNDFMTKETAEFNIGKRHLANMMGEDPETITQDEINKSIEYLFPSGLFEPRARPMMRPPTEIFPPRKAAEFDEAGRPFHSMFYTSKPNYYQLLYDIVEAINTLKEQRLKLRHSVQIAPQNEVNIVGSTWLTKPEIEAIVLEVLIDKDYDELVRAMERLLKYPGFEQYKDLIMKYRKPLMNETKQMQPAKLEYTSDGIPYITTERCMRKSARGEVTIRGKGSGKITINGQSILYFDDVQAREQVIFPLIFTGLSNTVDVEATVRGGGPSGQAGAIRWGIAWGLRSFVDPDMIERMRIAGLLKRDHRIRERKKPGQEGARRKFTWKKR